MSSYWAAPVPLFPEFRGDLSPYFQRLARRDLSFRGNVETTG